MRPSGKAVVLRYRARQSVERRDGWFMVMGFGGEEWFLKAEWDKNYLGWKFIVGTFAGYREKIL